MTTHPTPTAAVRDLARSTIAGYFTSMGLTDERRARFDADQILAALAAKGISLCGPGHVAVNSGDLDMILDAAIEHISEQAARLPNMILDVERSSTAVYIDAVQKAMDNVYTALSAGAGPDGEGTA